MNISRRQALVSVSAFALAGCATSQGGASAPNTALHAFFEQAFETALDQSPELATTLGDKRRYGEWDDESEAFEAQQLRDTLAARDRMRASFDPARLNPQDALSLRLFDIAATRTETNHRWRNHRYIFNHHAGAQVGIPAFLMNQHAVHDAGDAEALIARYRGLGVKMDQLIERANASAAMGAAPPRFSYEGVIEASRNVITGAPFTSGADSPLWANFQQKANALAIAQPQKDRLLADGRAALLEGVQPAYQRLIEAMTAQQARATTDDGAWKLPDGDSYYANRLRHFTTTDMSADAVHDLGLENVARIHDEMRAIMRATNFNGDLAGFFRFMESEDRFYVADSAEGRAEYVRRATEVIDALRPRLPDFFGLMPRAPMEVRAVEPFRERSAGLAFYSRPSPDGSRPGIYYVNTYDVRAIPLYQLEALAYHEGLPGHHMQIAIAQELEGVPRFRRFLSFYTAYSEGWGLYTERLGKEMGGYQDPYSEFGRLVLELRRAIRLVVDTGLHHKRWPRQQAIDYVLANQPANAREAARDIGRYIVNPGQATAYMIGQQEILRLREAARAAMGARFTMAGFHDAVLENGAVPLDVLGELVRAWSARA